MIHFGDFTLTKREIIFSIVIIALMITLGLVIHGAIDNNLMLKHQEYNTALQINEDAEMFKYGMNTNVGNSYVYGELKAVDTVTFEEIGGEYSYVKKVKEKYTMHTRIVTYTDSDGDTHTKIETYWTWDEVKCWSKHSDKITFLTVEFDYGTIPLPSSEYITTIQESSKIRYKYYGAPISCKGTIYTDLRDNTINDTTFYTYKTIEEALEYMTSRAGLVVFWVLWTGFTGFVVYGFIHLENYWLEDSYPYKRRRKSW